MRFFTPKLIRRLLCILLSLRLLFLFWTNLPLYTQSFDIQDAKDAYFASTYIKGDKGDITLSDSDLYLVEGHFLVGENYDLEKLTELEIDLLIIDGPPGFLQKHSRYPALLRGIHLWVST